VHCSAVRPTYWKAKLLPEQCVELLVLGLRYLTHSFTVHILLATVCCSQAAPDGSCNLSTLLH
jgi:hypothetical protein